MNRNMLALAVAGAFAVPGLAMAQSTVQIYGNVRILFENVDPDTIDGPGNQNGSRWRVNNPGGSRIGFKGTEALGGGTSAWFQIESNISGTDGTSGGALGSRNTAVGLRGGFGNVFLGNWDSPYKLQLTALQPWGATTSYGSVGIMGHGDTTGPAFVTTGTFASTANLASVASYGFERRLNNSVQYQSPSFGGFQGKFAYQANEGKNTTVGNSDPDLWSASLVYNNGPIYAGLAYERHNDFLGRDLTDDGLNLSLRYRTRVFDIGVSWERLEYEPTQTTDLERDAWQIFGQYFIGPHRIGLGFIKADDSEGSYTAGPAVGAIGPAGTNNGAKQWTLH